MKQVYFAIALHFHQPVGNFENIFERAYRLCYYPYLNLLSDYPEINMTLHLSGSLLDYLEAKHPEILERLKKMISRGQIEMLGGGYYEPIFTAIPENDLAAQIRMMSGYIKEKFNFSARGLWLPERVWEPWLGRFISKMDMDYTILDDTHLLKARVPRKGIRGYFLTPGKFAVFASDKTLRYKIPFRAPWQTIDYLRRASSDKEKNSLIVYGDDVEKFGEWPGTHKWVYEQGWLRKFFDLLAKNRDWIKPVKLSDYLETNSPRGRVNIPSASYEEMLKWSGGSWMNFLSRYPESDQMHKKMCYVSNKIERLSKAAENKNKKQLEEAKRELYKGQCNCAYWHGLFGGLYLYHLRQAVYNHLIKAEKITDQLLHGSEKEWLDIKRVDYDLDKRDEMIMENEAFSLYLDPGEGGVIKELDYKPLSSNLINTLSRRREPYHKKILKRKLYYDKFPRYCLRDHFTNSAYQERGGFADGKYTVKRKGNGILLERKAKLLKAEFKLSKQIEIRSRKRIEVSYHLKKYGSREDDILLGIEFNLTLPALNSPRYRYFSKTNFLGGLDKEGSLNEVDSFAICDSEKELGVSFNFSRKAKGLWYFPVMSISQSEKDYQANYQSSCILPRWKPVFDKNGVWRLKISVDIIH